MLKVGPPTFRTVGTSWDHQGKSEISQIFISSSHGEINSIHFAYVEDGGKKIVLSDTVGGQVSNTSMETITFDHPTEYITRLTGCYRTVYGRNYLGSITIHTNKGTHGPCPPLDPRKYNYVLHFNYDVGGKFCGFYGTYLSDGIESLGFYMKPLEKLAAQPSADRPLVPKLEYPGARRR